MRSHWRRDYRLWLNVYLAELHGMVITWRGPMLHPDQSGGHQVTWCPAPTRRAAHDHHAEGDRPVAGPMCSPYREVDQQRRQPSRGRQLAFG